MEKNTKKMISDLYFTKQNPVMPESMIDTVNNFLRIFW